MYQNHSIYSGTSLNNLPELKGTIKNLYKTENLVPNWSFQYIYIPKEEKKRKDTNC